MRLWNWRPSKVFTKKPERLKGWPTILATYDTGSHYICNPPVTNTDIDKFVLVSEFPDRDWMEEQGWEPCAKEEYPNNVVEAYRMGNKNIILMTDKERYICCVAATALAKDMNLLDKKDRVGLHEFLVRGERYEGPIPGEGGLL